MSPALKPFVLYYHGPSPNPWKVGIILEELGLPWELASVDNSELKQEPFISLNPNGRVPALVDPNKDVTLWESGAIIDYLVAEYDKDAKLQYTSFPEKYTTRCWEHFQMSGQGPYFGQKGWFTIAHPEHLPSVLERYRNEIKRVTGVIDAHLAKHKTDYLVGNRITYADLMFIPYFMSVTSIIAPEIDMTQWPVYTAWLNRMLARPAVAKVVAKQSVAAAKAMAERKAEAEAKKAAAGA